MSIAGQLNAKKSRSDSREIRKKILVPDTICKKLVFLNCSLTLKTADP